MNLVETVNQKAGMEERLVHHLADAWVGSRGDAARLVEDVKSHLAAALLTPPTPAEHQKALRLGVVMFGHARPSRWPDWVSNRSHVSYRHNQRALERIRSDLAKMILKKRSLP